MNHKTKHQEKFFNDHLEMLRDKIAKLEKAAADEMHEKERWANEAERLQEENEKLRKALGKEGA